MQEIKRNQLYRSPTTRFQFNHFYIFNLVFLNRSDSWVKAAEITKHLDQFHVTQPIHTVIWQSILLQVLVFTPTLPAIAQEKVKSWN